jgi:hypothetical protein
MDTRSNRSASPTPEELNSPTRFLDEVEARWPGSTRISRLIAQHDKWLKRKRTDGRSWFDIITGTLDENFEPEDKGDEYTYDAN